MKTYIRFLLHLAQYFLEWEKFQTKVVEKIKTHYYVEIKCQLDATDDIYCRFYCMLNMFRAILCASSGAREYYTDGRCLWYLVLWFSGCPYGVELKIMRPVCRLLLLFPHNKEDAPSKSLQIKTHILCSVIAYQNRAFCEIMWKKCGKAAEVRDGNIIRRMHFACWIQTHT